MRLPRSGFCVTTGEDLAEIAGARLAIKVSRGALNTDAFFHLTESIVTERGGHRLLVALPEINFAANPTPIGSKSYEPAQKSPNKARRKILVRFECLVVYMFSMARKGGSFKNIKLGKNVFRQIKRRGAPARPLPKQRPQKPQK